MNERDSRIFSELSQAAATYRDWHKIPLDSAPAVHIAVMSEPFLSFVFSGKKTVESRFSLNKIAPYKKVQRGDIVFMKAGMVVGCFTVKWVKYFELSEAVFEHITATYSEAICADAVFWQRKRDKRYVTLLGIKTVLKLTPIRISKFDRRAWLSLD